MSFKSRTVLVSNSDVKQPGGSTGTNYSHDLPDPSEHPNRQPGDDKKPLIFIGLAALALIALLK